MIKSFLIQQALNGTVLKPYGKMLNLSIDSKEKTLSCTILPKGETEPIRIDIMRYAIESDGDKKVLVIEEIQVSREWMDVIAKKVASGARVPLEGALSAVVPLIL